MNCKKASIALILCGILDAKAQTVAAGSDFLVIAEAELPLGAIAAELYCCLAEGFQITSSYPRSINQGLVQAAINCSREVSCAADLVEQAVSTNKPVLAHTS